MSEYNHLYDSDAFSKQTVYVDAFGLRQAGTIGIRQIGERGGDEETVEELP